MAGEINTKKEWDKLKHRMSIPPSETYTVSFRPRKGEPRANFEAICKWCLSNSISFSEFFNTMLGPLAFYCENYSAINEQTNNIEVVFNIGKITFQITNEHPIRDIVANQHTAADKRIGR